ncbi:MAG TPA: IS701 family transposase [Ktedonobacteraceae bacterium]|nr:IS701 family transposase [Ktedonobacteraceae bacterium]
MSLMVDVTADQPPLPGRPAVQNLASEEVAGLAEELVAYHQHFAPLFYRREQREWAAIYLRGLLTADVPRKNVEAMALRLLGAGPHAEREVRALQQFIGEGKWDDDALLAKHQRLVNETLGEEDGVLIVDGSDFPKHGDHSAGVAPQWCGHTGKKDNCQAGVFLGYASRKGATLLDRRLYLPESWFAEDHRPLWQDCQIPDEIAFQTKHNLAAQLVENVMASGRLQARWVVCDEGYGDSPAFLQRLDATGLWYLAEVSRDTKVWPLLETDGQTERARPSSWVRPQVPSRKGPAPRRERLHPTSPAKVAVEDLAKQWPVSHWQRFRLLEGHKGPLVADFLVLRAILPLDRLPGPEVWVVIRRKVSGSPEEPEWKFYLSNAPLETPLATFVRVSGMRWPIETCFAECNGELGMDHYELRFWRGWHHHMTLVILAHHFLVRWQQRLNQREGGLAPDNHAPFAHTR